MMRRLRRDILFRAKVWVGVGCVILAGIGALWYASYQARSNVGLFEAWEVHREAMRHLAEVESGILAIGQRTGNWATGGANGLKMEHPKALNESWRQFKRLTGQSNRDFERILSAVSQNQGAITQYESILLTALVEIRGEEEGRMALIWEAYQEEAQGANEVYLPVLFVILLVVMLGLGYDLTLIKLNEKRTINAFSQPGHEVVESMLENMQREKMLQEGLHNIVDAMERFAAGDLTVTLATEREDAFSDAYTYFNSAMENVRMMMLVINESVQLVTQSMTVVTDSAHELMNNATDQVEQAGTIQESVDEMAATLSDNARIATGASDLARQSGQVAREGSDVVRQTLQKIEQIAAVIRAASEKVESLAHASQAIGNATTVIHDISDQTTLLALNAAIEAARAGEEAHGFAVVADEVRKLSERTSDATVQIDAMVAAIQQSIGEARTAIQEGLESVNEGTMLSGKAGEVLTSILENVMTTIEMAEKIAAGSTVQSETSLLIAQRVEEITALSRQSVENVGGISASMAITGGITETLASLVARVNFNSDGVGGLEAMAEFIESLEEDGQDDTGFEAMDAFMEGKEE